MPILRRRSDDGWYIKGRAHGIGFVTWQVRQAGREYLSVRNLRDDGDFVPPADVRELVRRGWVYTGGGGVGLAAAGVDALADQLVAWAAGGATVARFEAAFPVGRWAEVFSDRFRGWLRRLDPTAGWGWLAGVSAVAFETAAGGRPGALDDGDDVHAELARRGAGFVFWRLGRLVGGADASAGGVLGWLAGWRQAEPRPTGGDAPPRTIPPRIVWRIDLQQVVAVLPEQTVPPSARGVTWTVGGHPPIPLTASRGRIPERESRPLWPAASYRVALQPTGGDFPAQQWEFELPPIDGPVVLFHPNGELVDVTDPDPLVPGEYLALVRRPVDGLELVEPVDVRPVGWSGWAGYRVRVAAGANVPGYQVSDDDPAARLELSASPPIGVRWLGEEPVYVGPLPMVTGGVTGAELVVSVGGQSHRVPLRDARPVDLNTVVAVAALAGRFTLNLRWPKHPDRCVPSVSFTRLPAVTLAEVPDAVHPNAATAIQVSGVGVGGFTPADGTEVRAEGAGVFVLWATSPVSSPGVIARHTDGWEVRARVAVSRGCVIGPAGFGGWQPLPVPGIDLRTVGLNHLLRLEFVTPPATSDGRLVTRHSGGMDVYYGDGPGDPPRVFEIELHRWRDSFGSCGGSVQAFAGGRWTDVVVLEGETAVALPPALPSPVEALLERLQHAADAEQPVGELVGECLTLFAATPWADRLPLIAGRICLATNTPLPERVVDCIHVLAARGDVPAAGPLAELLGVRRGGEWDFARVEQVRGRLNAHPESMAVEAECWYRYARANPDRPTHQSIQLADSTDLMTRYLRPDPVGVAFSEGVLLREVTDLLRGNVSSDRPLSGLLPSHRGWTEAIRTAFRFVRSPLPSWTRTPVPSLGAAPSVLHPDDAILVRAILVLASGDRGGEHWESVRHRGRGFFSALPLLTARFTRDRADYLAAWHAAQQDGPDWMTEVILAER